MRTAFTFIVLFFIHFHSIAQCADFGLADLQALQRATNEEKDAVITDQGFDLNIESEGIKRYNKCWKGTLKGNELYDRVVWWNTKANNITFLTPDEAVYSTLRTSIESRKKPDSGGYSSDDIYIGKVFKYRFFIQMLDGTEYFAVTISFKNG